jgi:hypothetical protein
VRPLLEAARALVHVIGPAAVGRLRLLEVPHATIDRRVDGRLQFGVVDDARRPIVAGANERGQEQQDPPDPHHPYQNGSTRRFSSLNAGS